MTEHTRARFWEDDRAAARLRELLRGQAAERARAEAEARHLPSVKAEAAAELAELLKAEQAKAADLAVELKQAKAALTEATAEAKAAQARRVAGVAAGRGPEMHRRPNEAQAALGMVVVVGNKADAAGQALSKQQRICARIEAALAELAS